MKPWQSSDQHSYLLFFCQKSTNIKKEYWVRQFVHQFGTLPCLLSLGQKSICGQKYMKQKQKSGRSCKTRRYCIRNRNLMSGCIITDDSIQTCLNINWWVKHNCEACFRRSNIHWENLLCLIGNVQERNMLELNSPERSLQSIFKTETFNTLCLYVHLYCL